MVKTPLQAQPVVQTPLGAGPGKALPQGLRWCRPGKRGRDNTLVPLDHLPVVLSQAFKDVQ